MYQSYHPSCTNKHRVIDTNNELIPCKDPYEVLKIGKEETKDSPSGFTKSQSGSTHTDVSKNVSKTDPRTKMRGNMADNMASNEELEEIMVEMTREVKTIKNFAEKTYDELVNAKQETKDLKREIHELKSDEKKEHKELEKTSNAGTRDKDKKSYSEVMKENKKENIILVKPKTQENSEGTEKIIKEKVDIKKDEHGSLEIQKRHQRYDRLRV